jgi:nucleoside phosphorylase
VGSRSVMDAGVHHALICSGQRSIIFNEKADDPILQQRKAWGVELQSVTLAQFWLGP